MLMKRSSSTESLMRKHHSSFTQGHCLSKTKKKTVSKEPLPSSKQQTFSENVHQDGKQGCSTDSDQDMPSTFTEIWPSEFSPSDTPTSVKSAQKSPEQNMPHISLLAKYVDRFRHGQPQSREERKQKASNDRDEQQAFWWKSSSLPHSLTPEESSNVHAPAQTPCKGSINMLDTSQSEFYENEILLLQERASRLLQKGEFCLEEDSLPVSSDGVGCSDFSSPVSADEPVRRSTVPSLLQCSIAKDSLPVIPSVVAPVQPEKDILFQWRLMRKMEKAREWTQAQQHFNPQDFHSLHPIITLQTIHPSDSSNGTKPLQVREPPSFTSDQQTQTTSVSATRTSSVDASGSLVSLPHALAHVPSHMHFLCDILPCSTQSTHLCEESVPQRQQSRVDILPQRANTKFVSFPKTESVEKHLNLPRTKSTEAPKKQPEKTEKSTSVPSKQHKKSAWVHQREKYAKTIESAQQLKPKCTAVNKNSSTDGPPLSPIHSALGQVVSEVLFPSMDSTVAPKISPATPSCPVSVPKECNSHKSGEIISQLLLEAEDSDEKEFEDDPLLKVLRKQRKWVKEQITEVDVLLKDFPEQHKM